jgi:tetratricopeptide (TPR) repeat protein
MKAMLMQLLRVVFFVPLILGMVAGAHAEEMDNATRARVLSNKGLDDFDHKRYDDAIAAFSSSYALAPLPALAFNIAQAYRLKGDCAAALRFYRAYLRELPDAPNRERAETQMGAMQACVDVQAKPVAHDDHAAAPASPPVTTAASQPTPSAAHLDAKLTQAPPQKKPLYKKWWLWTVVGGVVAAGAITGVAVATTRPPVFNANLPESGPAAHAIVFGRSF